MRALLNVDEQCQVHRKLAERVRANHACLLSPRGCISPGEGCGYPLPTMCKIVERDIKRQSCAYKYVRARTSTYKYAYVN